MNSGAESTPRNLLRHGVNSAVLRLARNFCDSRSIMPMRATMYPGKATHTTSSTASKTSKHRWGKSGCWLWDGSFLKASIMSPPVNERLFMATKGGSGPTVRRRRDDRPSK
jgi:hypothetical protein